MFEAADERVKQWASASLGPGIPARLSAPTAADADGVSLYLLDLQCKPPARGAPAPHAEVVLRYLVSATAATPEAGHGALGRLFGSAIAQPDFEIDPVPPPLELWLALGVVPRPAFVIRLPVRMALPMTRGVPVRRPMQVELGPIVPLQGTLVGPGDEPIADALVEVPAVHRSTRTDPRGRFTLEALPAAPCVLRVVAKGREFTIETVPGAASPLRIPLESTEE